MMFPAHNLGFATSPTVNRNRLPQPSLQEKT
jgi:hypothetical protein